MYLRRLQVLKKGLNSPFFIVSVWHMIYLIIL